MTDRAMTTEPTTAPDPGPREMQDGPNVRKLDDQDSTSVTLVNVSLLPPHVGMQVWHVPTRVVRAIESPLQARIAELEAGLRWWASARNGSHDQVSAHDHAYCLSSTEEALGSLLAPAREEPHEETDMTAFKDMFGAGR